MTEQAKFSPAAEKFIQRFGRDAPAEASKRAAELRRAGNVAGSATWEMIYREVKALVEGDTSDTSR